MKKLVGSLLLVGFLSGCLVRTHPRNGHRNSSRRSTADCPPSQHWNGHRCEHNGRARGHKKHRH